MDASSEHAAFTVLWAPPIWAFAAKARGSPAAGPWHLKQRRRTLFRLVSDANAIDVIASAMPQESNSKELASAQLAAIRDQYPAYQGEMDRFARYLHGKLQAENAPNLESIHGSDLFLAWGICEHEAGFAEELLARYHSDLVAALRKIGLSASEVEEAKQRLIEQVMVGANGNAPGVSNYAGRGPLGAWLRTAAVRTGLSLARARKTHEQPDGLELLPTTDADPELRLLKDTYRSEFAAALQEALTGLGVRERNLLRQHYIDGLSSSELGALYKVHKATAARWVVAARDALADGAKLLLRHRLQVSPTELDSIAKLVRSDLHVSIGRLLLRSR